MPMIYHGQCQLRVVDSSSRFNFIDPLSCRLHVKGKIITTLLLYTAVIHDTRLPSSSYSCVAYSSVLF